MQDVIFVFKKIPVILKWLFIIVSLRDCDVERRMCFHVQCSHEMSHLEVESITLHMNWKGSPLHSSQCLPETFCIDTTWRSGRVSSFVKPQNWQIFLCKPIILSVSSIWFWKGPCKGLKWLTWTVVKIKIPHWHETNGFYMVLREPYPEVEVQAWDKKSWRPVCRLVWMHNWSQRFKSGCT